ncbi:hypothetical protein ACP3T3_00725 [Chryseobacterium sp. CBSDS_008]|uniref:hypothetical protein n=1 Tax=Chryseobacterium sp. CBSDS_008 TaxID=3415265 RepID=UPI003CED3D6C
MKHKLLQENCNTINCYKQGVFWITYQQSAYQIWKIRQYKAISKYIKYLKQTVTSVSFPESALMEIIKYFECQGCTVEKSDSYIKIQLIESICLRDFIHWKVRSNTSNVEQEIMSFNLENKTPMDAFQLIGILQITLKNNLIVKQ